MNSVLRFIFVFNIHILASISYAQDLNNLPGRIPIGNSEQAASDLWYNGRALLPDEARALVSRGVVADLSDLNPDNTSDIWKNEYPHKLNPIGFDLSLQRDGEAVSFLTYRTSPIGHFQFMVEKKVGGVSKSYKVWVGPKMRNILLRRALIEKLGYRVPKVQYVKNFQVTFPGVSTRESFVDRMEKGNKVNHLKFLTREPSGSDDSIIFKEAIVLEANPQIYDFSTGSMVASVIAGRRLFNALLIPYVVVDAAESVNRFRWHIGRIENNQVYLPYDGNREFTTTYSDARWISKRIAQLSREDWRQVVSQAKYPDGVSELVLEKVISRRNHLLSLFGLSLNFEPLTFDDQISYSSIVEGGKLIKKDWSDYSAEFAKDDPDSPVNGGEIFALFQSKLLSNAISNLVKWVNDNQIPSTNLQKEIIDHQIDVSAKQFAEFLKTGKISETPFGIWTTPYIDGNLIASRDVVAGSYLGAENMVQLADTIGFNVATGLYVGADGLPTKLGVNGRAQIFHTLTYTHLKPINSIKLAIREPLSNMLVPIVTRKYAQSIKPILDGSIQELDDEAKQEVVNQVVANFKDNLGVGESLIVSKVLGGAIAVGGGYSLTERVALQATVNNQLQKFSRLHIFRADEDTIHVYKDPARMNEFGFSFGLEAEIEILRVSLRSKSGKAESHFYEVNLEADLGKNPEIIDNLSGLHRVFSDKKVDHLKLVNEPIVVSHKFKEKSHDFSLLRWRWLGLNSQDQINVALPNGQSSDYIRSTLGKRKGKNNEDFGIDVLNELLEHFTESEIAVTSQTSGDSADTFFGSSQSRQLALDWQIGSSEDLIYPEEIRDQFAEFTYKWRGWEIGKEKIDEIMRALSDFYGTELFAPSILAQTEKIQLYTLSLSIALYEGGIESLLSKSDEWILATFQYNPRESIWVEKGEFEFGNSLALARRRWESQQAQIDSFFRAKDKYFKKLEKNDLKGASKELTKVLSLAERLVTFQGFTKLFGVDDNYHIQASLQGFRIGDEDGDRPYISNSVGAIGGDLPGGPLNEIQRRIGMTRSEFFILWLLERI